MPKTVFDKYGDFFLENIDLLDVSKNQCDLERFIRSERGVWARKAFSFLENKVTINE